MGVADLGKVDGEGAKGWDGVVDMWTFRFNTSPQPHYAWLTTR